MVQGQVKLSALEASWVSGTHKAQQREIEMNKIVSCMSIGVVCFLIAPTQSMATGRAGQSPNPATCSAPEYRQFDFWAGAWDAFDLDNPTMPVARAQVDRILDGCVLREDYQGTDGHKGQSFTIYDATRKLWHQTWVTNRGELLWIEGTMQDGAIVLSGVDRAADGKERKVRGAWKPVTGGVSEAAVTSTDGGKTWKPWFDLIFRPAARGTESDTSRHENTKTKDQAIIAALDTEYQAAVKKNDATTMDRILADDFVLVTGSGKTYSKADLLDEARSGSILYEHQEDSEQTVRVWGDFAVITAKLWEKGTNNGKPFDYTAWFSDTYVRTPAGWRYVFAQSSLPLPNPH